MITPAYCQRMVRYNQWQNDNIYGAADTLSDEARRADRGGFFKSIYATLSHILWADRIWMSRLSDWQAPGIGIPGSTDLFPEWAALKVERAASDAAFLRWGDMVQQTDIDGDLTYANSAGVTNTRNRAICLIQVFNHQTHHRGQVHAMLTAAGAAPSDTDVPFMPEMYF